MRLFIVREADYCYDEANHKLIAAVDPDQARSVWLKSMGLVEADGVELDVEPAQWRWIGVPEPTLPTEPGEWMPGGKTPDGLEMWRGYGFYDIDDDRCEDCDGHFPREHMHDEYVCRECHAGTATGEAD